MTESGITEKSRRLAVHVTRLSPYARYGAAVAATAGGLILRLALDPIWGDRLPFMLAFPAIAVSAWLGGFWPGIVTTLLSAVAAEYFWLQPRGSWPAAADVVAMGAFVCVGAAISGLNEAWRRGVVAGFAMERERRALLEQERHARADAEHANQVKDRFLSMVSHDLRTPLNAVLGYAELLTLGTLSDDDRAEAIAAIQRNARMQAELIDSLLDLARIQGGKLELRLGEIELSSVVSRAADVARPAAGAKGIALDVTLPEAPVMIVGDGARVQQIVWNLLSNALKFTPSGGRVEVSLAAVDSRTDIRVSDNGQGIRAEFMPHVFERFAQAPDASLRPDGLGIGLAIVRELVDAHGGTVRGESDGDGRGSTFIVSLPARVRTAEPVDLRVSTPREGFPAIAGRRKDGERLSAPR